MYQGKYSSDPKRSRTRRTRRVRANKPAALFLAVLLLLGVVVGSTIAYLIADTTPVENSFTYAKVSCQVTESFNETTKSNVQIKNTGTTEAYIRATWVVNWLDSNGKIAASVPAEYSYSLTPNPDGTWQAGNDGYYYYWTPVAPGASTPGSLLTCTVTYPENPEYTLSVEILATAVQSAPAKAVQEAWGVTAPAGN